MKALKRHKQKYALAPLFGPPGRSMSCLKQYQVCVKQHSQAELDTWVSCRQCVYPSSSLDIETLWSGSAYNAVLQPRQGQRRALSSCCCQWTSSSGGCVCWHTSSGQSPTSPRTLADTVVPTSMHTNDRSVTFVWGPGEACPQNFGWPLSWPHILSPKIQANMFAFFRFCV